jgi:hypothetical protein
MGALATSPGNAASVRLDIGRKLGLVEVGRQRSLRVRCAHLGEQAVAGADRLGEKVVLGCEVRIKSATRQPSREHDVVDVGADIAAQSKQPGSMLEDIGPRSGFARSADRHDMLYII